MVPQLTTDVTYERQTISDMRAKRARVAENRQQAEKRWKITKDVHAGAEDSPPSRGGD